MKRRKPQPRCVCGHAKSQHAFYPHYSDELICGYCWDECPNYRMDNLATLERLAIFNEEKNRS
jgi:hypothetical protein